MRTIFTLVLLALSASSFAHQEKAAISTLLFNPRTEQIEVSHRFYLHDAEHAVKHIFGKDADIIASEHTRKAFFKYVADRFQLASGKGTVIPLQPVGFEVQGKFFWAYQQAAAPKDVKTLVIKHDALRDIWKNQVNTLNIEGKGKIQTRIFDGNADAKSVELHHHH